MVKLVFCLRRDGALSREEFQSYWREQHAPLVRERAPLHNVVRYVQSHTLDSLSNAAVNAPRGGPEPYDGVAELWWEDMAAFEAAGATSEGRHAARELLDDERRFIDFSQSPIFLATEHEVVAYGTSRP